MAARVAGRFQEETGGGARGTLPSSCARIVHPGSPGPNQRKLKPVSKMENRSVAMGIPSNFSRLLAFTPRPMSPLLAMAAFVDSKSEPIVSSAASAS